MTRRRPAARPLLRGHPMDLASPAATPPVNTPPSQGDAIEAFLVGGGQTFYLDGWAFPDSGAPPQLGAVQLVAAQYVPKGRAAWVKSITIAPCVPPILADPWRGWDNTFNYFEPFIGTYGTRQRAAAQAGLWETPLAWEGFYNPPGELGSIRPRWNWQLSVLNGDLKTIRASRNLPPFDPSNPATFYLVPDVAVPRFVYAGGIPGRHVPGYVGPQRFQQCPGNALPVHIQIPENSTICLWATWEQLPFTPLAANNGVAMPVGPVPALPPTTGGDLVWPLLPSVGSIAGYMQAATRPAANENAAFGWGG